MPYRERCARESGPTFALKSQGQPLWPAGKVFTLSDTVDRRIFADRAQRLEDTLQ